MTEFKQGIGAPETLTLSAMGEFDVIDKLREIAESGAKRVGAPTPHVGSGDDSAVIEFETSNVAMSVDMFVEEKHFRTDWATGIDIGRRCAAASMSDICAMGTMPTTLLVAMAAPSETPFTLIREIFSGLVEEAGIAGAQVVGGDMSAGEKIVISVTALGSCPKKGVLKRSDAKVGDVVAINGVLGRAAAGLRVLQRGLRAPRVLVDAYRYPTIDYAAGVEARKAGAHAMMDISDGLIADLGHMARASHVTVDIETASLRVTEELTSIASAFGVDPLQWVLTGGDDNVLAATFSPGTELPPGFYSIGQVREFSDHVVTVDGSPASEAGGFSHFSA